MQKYITLNSQLTMKGQPQTTYQMTVTWADGDHRANASGSLRFVLEYISNHVPIAMDSYHKVRRELLRTGGAYSSFFPAHVMPMQVVIIEKKLVAAPIERELAQVVDTVQRGRYERAQDEADIEADNVVYQRPDFYSGFGATQPAPSITPINAQPAAPVLVDCANCSTPVEVVNGAGHCPYCVDLFTEKPSPVSFPLHSHPTLTWDQMSKWQRKQYVIKS